MWNVWVGTCAHTIRCMYVDPAVLRYKTSPAKPIQGPFEHFLLPSPVYMYIYKKRILCLIHGDVRFFEGYCLIKQPSACLVTCKFNFAYPLK